MAKKNLVGKLIAATAVMGVIAFNYIGANHASKSNGYRAMPRIQPWIFLYDLDRDGEADETMVSVGGPWGGCRATYTRDSTEEEREWYRNN